jgi:HSP20 family protein
MHQQQSCAAKGARYGSNPRHFQYRSNQRAAVNIYKTENSYEILLFAPGRIKENFDVQVKGQELIVSYNPPEGFPRTDWVLREYSRGGFVRSFQLDSSIDVGNIAATYKDGVLQLSLPKMATEEAAPQSISIS